GGSTGSSPCPASSGDDWGEDEAMSEQSEAPAAEEQKPQAPTQPAPQQPAGPPTVERYGRLMRVFPVAVAADVMAQAWANRESAPDRAAVIVEHEINPRGLHGVLWQTPPPDTLACAMVLRPPVSVEEADVTWLVGALAAANAIE